MNMELQLFDNKHNSDQQLERNFVAALLHRCLSINEFKNNIVSEKFKKE